MKSNKYLFAALMFAGLMSMTSCNNDESYDVMGNPDNLVYINLAQPSPVNMPKNTYAYKLLQLPVGPILTTEPGEVKLYVQCTKKPTSDITVKFEMDPTVEVDGYDKFPANSGFNASLTKNTVTIAAGTNHSDTVTVSIDATNADWTKFDGTAYVLPIRITDVTGGAVASVEQNFAYIGVNVEHKEGMLNTSATSATGTRITDCSAWTGTYEVPNAGVSETALNMSKLIDNNSRTYDYIVWNHADKVNEEVITTIDMGSVKAITSCMYRYLGVYYTIKDGTLYTSTDGVNYTEQGTMTWESAGTTRYFAFWAPIEARYIRLVAHSFYGGTGEGQVLSDINVYE
ncbi:MAG: DUF1735 domain-containing protein [Muribaculaceae bacterium]|nr:DUF1735 domain-containing protein [Muribaculaceae bacterium]